MDGQMPAPLTSILESFWTALGGELADLGAIEVAGTGALPSTFAVTDFAGAAVAAAAAALREIVRFNTGSRPMLTVDRRLSSMWFAMSIRPQGWSLPALRDPVTGDYRTRDGWIRIHANAPRHRAAAEQVLACADDPQALARAVGSWNAGELESAIVAAGGCAAQLRSCRQWREHPQGTAVESEPLIHWTLPSGRPPPGDRPPGAPDRPLAGVRVLDLTRVLAGPVATRFLAGYGAEVLRIDPPHWDEPGIVPEVTLGKRCTRLDLNVPTGRERFESLLRTADILVHGYRPGALAALGYGAQALQQLAPGLIEASLDAYGWSGPWSQRRGFDSLVQMSAGIAAAGMTWRAAARPIPLPVQALDHATGYLLAAAALRGLAQQLATGRGSRARLSLARTAGALIDCGTREADPPLEPECAHDIDPRPEATPWGAALRLRPPVRIEGVPMYWTLPATPLGSAAASW